MNAELTLLVSRHNSRSKEEESPKDSSEFLFEYPELREFLD